MIFPVPIVAARAADSDWSCETPPFLVLRVDLSEKSERKVFLIIYGNFLI